MQEKHLLELVEQLRQAAGSNLLAVVLHGSAAKAEFNSEFSDVNLLCIVRDLSAPVLSTLATALESWSRSGYSAPLIFSRNELERSTDVFAIEMLDIQQHHRILHGEDMFQNLHVPMDKHRTELEHELRTKLLFLRQHYLLAPKDNKKIAGLMLDSISSFVTLFRHTLLTLGETPPRTKHEIVEELGRRLQFEPRPFLDLLKVREHHLKAEALDVHETFSAYLQGIDKVIEAVDAL